MINIQAILQYVQMIIGGISSTFTFILSIPSYFASILTLIPPEITVLLYAVLGIVIAIRVLELIP